MTTILQDKYKCLECGHICESEDMLTAPNPFDVYSQESIVGCPKCHQVENMVKVCDEPGCKAEATCGTPTDEVYRRTCIQHDPHNDPHGKVRVSGVPYMVDRKDLEKK
jgi:hypothetical protein